MVDVSTKNSYNTVSSLTFYLVIPISGIKSGRGRPGYEVRII